MEIIKNDGKRCILWLSCDCCEDDGEVIVVPPDTGAFKVVEEPLQLLSTFYPNDTAKPSFPIQPNTELVFINGTQQTRGRDYSINYTDNLIFIFHGNEPKLPYENIVLSYITGDSDLGAYVDADIAPTSTNRPNDTIILSFVPKAGTEEVFIGGTQMTRGRDYLIDYSNKKITIFAGNEPKLPYESVTVSYFKNI